MMEAGKRGILVYQAWKLRVGIVLLVLVFSMGGWQLYQLGRANAAAELVSLAMESDKLKEQVASLDQQNSVLQRRVAVFERAKQVDAEAYSAIRDERISLDNEIHALQEELNFYRGIMSPSKAKVGLQAQDLVVEPLFLSDRSVKIRLMLVQIKSNQQVVKGNLKMTLKGVLKGKPQQYALEDVATAKHGKIKYRFRYFQPVEDEWVLPEGFVPEQLIVKAVSAIAKQPSLEWTFQWPANGEDAEEVRQNVGTEG